MDEQAQLDQWIDEYDLDKPISFRGYSDLGRNVLGYWTVKDKLNMVFLNARLQGHDLMTKALLWHEFCHAWEWIQEGTSGHGPAFLKRLFRKPWYPIIEFFAAIYNHVAP